MDLQNASPEQLLHRGTGSLEAPDGLYERQGGDLFAKSADAVRGEGNLDKIDRAGTGSMDMVQ